MTKKSGICRAVYLVGNYAIKTPNCHCRFNYFILGIKSNWVEWRIWRKSKSSLLCPVVFWFVGIIVMKRVDMMAHKTSVRCEKPCKEIDERCRYVLWRMAGYGADLKPDNFGILNGELVKIDYGHDVL